MQLFANVAVKKFGALLSAKFDQKWFPDDLQELRLFY